MPAGKLAAVLLGAAMVLGRAEPAPNPDSGPLPGIRDKYLLLDSRVVERVDHAMLRVGSAAKHPSGPLFGEELPWEQNLGHMYASVVYDESEKRFKLWYYTTITPVLEGQREWFKDIAPGPMAPDPFKTEMHGGRKLRVLKEESRSWCSLLYATSGDGIHWSKPPLELYHYKGKPTNIVILRDYGTGVFKDAHDPDPARRYKLVNGGPVPGCRICVAFSPDGINWSELEDTKVAAAADGFNNAFWAADLGRYVAISRGWSNGALAWNLSSPLPWKALNGGVRTVVRTESKDFVNWSAPEEVLRGPPEAQVYTMPVFSYAGVYLALPAILRRGAVGRLQTELAWSPDTRVWHRIDEGTPLIPVAEKKGSPDWGGICAASAPIVWKDEIRLYYAGEPAAHGLPGAGYFCLATLPIDRWAGYVPDGETGDAAVLTRPLVCNGATLRLTADVDPSGSVKASVLDLAGRVLVEGEPIRASLTNGASAGVAALQGRAVRVRLEFHRAKVYALAFGP